jgi:hypothetical protein
MQCVEGKGSSNIFTPKPLASRRFVEVTLLHADTSRLHFFPVYMGLAQVSMQRVAVV